MSHLWDRLAEAKSRLAPVQSKYRVLFEDPTQPDAPAKVLVPDPNWMAAALAGIPPQVWRDYQGNRCIMRIVPVELIPSDRSFRNAWKINQETEMAA